MSSWSERIFRISNCTSLTSSWVETSSEIPRNWKFYEILTDQFKKIFNTKSIHLFWWLTWEDRLKAEVFKWSIFLSWSVFLFEFFCSSIFLIFWIFFGLSGRDGFSESGLEFRVILETLLCWGTVRSLCESSKTMGIICICWWGVRGTPSLLEQLATISIYLLSIRYLPNCRLRTWPFSLDLTHSFHTSIM